MDRTRKRDGRTDGRKDGRTVLLLYASQSSFGGINIHSNALDFPLLTSVHPVIYMWQIVWMTCSFM